MRKLLYNYFYYANLDERLVFISFKFYVKVFWWGLSDIFKSLYCTLSLRLETLKIHSSYSIKTK